MLVRYLGFHIGLHILDSYFGASGRATCFPKSKERGEYFSDSQKKLSHIQVPDVVVFRCAFCLNFQDPLPQHSHTPAPLIQSSQFRVPPPLYLLCPNCLYTYLFTTMSIINPTTTTASSSQLQGLPPSNNLYGHGAPFMAAATGCRSVATRHPYPSQRRRPVSARLPANQIAAFEQPYARLHDAKAGRQQREAGSG